MFTEADSRPSAIATGTVGIVFLVMAASFVIALDLTSISLYPTFKA